MESVAAQMSPLEQDCLYLFWGEVSHQEKKKQTLVHFNLYAFGFVCFIVFFVVVAWFVCCFTDIALYQGKNQEASCISSLGKASPSAEDKCMNLHQWWKYNLHPSVARPCAEAWDMGCFSLKWGLFWMWIWELWRIPVSVFLRRNGMGNMYWKENLEHLLKCLRVYLSKEKQNISGNILVLPCPLVLAKRENSNNRKIWNADIKSNKTL